MAYAVSMLRSAQRQLRKLESENQERVIAAVRALAEAPRPPGASKLTGREAWRIRVGSFRVIYEINDSEKMILIVVIGHRRDIYRP